MTCQAVDGSVVQRAEIADRAKMIVDGRDLFDHVRDLTVFFDDGDF